MFKSKKEISIVILILMVFLVAIIIGSVMLSINKSKTIPNNILDNKNNNVSDNWGLTINGNSISLPCSLDELTKTGLKITASENYYEALMSITNQTFSGYGAKSDGWKKGISLDLKTGSDVSKKEKNVTVSSINYEAPAYTFFNPNYNTSSFLTDSQFCIKNNITIGSKSEDVISTFGTDYEPKTQTDLNSVYALIFYENANSILTIGFEKGIVSKIKIDTY